MTTKQKQIKKPVAARSKTTKPLKAATSVKRASAAKKTTPSRRVKSARAMKPTVARVKRHAKKALVPHKDNQFLPHLIRVQGLIVVMVITLLTQVMYGVVTTGHVSVLGRVSNIQTAELLADTNKERQASGLGDLQLNDQLSQAAFLKAQHMFSEQYWAHVSPSGVQPWKWFGDTGYNYSYAGENLAKNYPTAQATVDAWMHSDAHRENILRGEYVDVGFAVVDGELEGRNTTLVVALYGAPATVAAVQSARSETTFAAPVAVSSQQPLAYFGSALEALSPVTIASLGLLAIVAIVGVAAHHYRKQLPKAWQKSWRMHHGIYTFVGMILLSALVILATGGGSI